MVQLKRPSSLRLPPRRSLAGRSRLSSGDSRVSTASTWRGSACPGTSCSRIDGRWNMMTSLTGCSHRSIVNSHLQQRDRISLHPAIWINISVTRKHSSRMRTARLSTVHASVASHQMSALVAETPIQ